MAGRCLTEASGGVNLDTVRDIAATGVDLISVGALTHSAPVLDLGLDFVDARRQGRKSASLNLPQSIRIWLDVLTDAALGGRQH